MIKDAYSISLGSRLWAAVACSHHLDFGFIAHQKRAANQLALFMLEG